MADIGITLAIATMRLADYLAAEKKVLDGQSYEIADRKLTRADLREIREGIVFWSGQVRLLDPTPAPARAVGRARRGTYRMR